MTVYTITGIDPGLVHTGVVVLRIDTAAPQLLVESFPIEGKDHATQISRLLADLNYPEKHIFIESYRERGNTFGTNPKMRALLAEMKEMLPHAKILDNMGVKKIVRKPLLEVLGLDKFPTTHHQDLEAAARILVYGMLKNDHLNKVLYSIVLAHLRNTPWPVQK